MYRKIRKMEVVKIVILLRHRWFNARHWHSHPLCPDKQQHYSKINGFIDHKHGRQVASYRQNITWKLDSTTILEALSAYIKILTRVSFAINLLLLTSRRQSATCFRHIPRKCFRTLLDLTIGRLCQCPTTFNITQLLILTNIWMHINLFFYYKCEPADALSTGYCITLQTCHYSDQCGSPFDEGSTWSAVGKPLPTSEFNTPVHDHVENIL